MRRTALFIVAVAALSVWTATVSAGEIHDAAAQGDLDRVKSLLSEDPSLATSLSERGGTALHLACYGGHVEITALLLDAGADIEARDGRGFTPLLWATYGGHASTVELLVGRGADINAAHEAMGFTPVGLAFRTECQKRQPPEMTRFLIDRGAEFDPNATDPFSGMQLLYIAIVFANTEMIDYMIELGGDVRITRDRDGKTPVNDAASRGLPGVVEVLISHGADVTTPDHEGNPPIRYAVEQGHTDVIELLLRNGATTDFVDRRGGSTLLHLAATNGYSGAVDVLIRAGCDVNARDEQDRTPIFYAAKYGNPSCAEILVEHGADRTGILEENYGVSPYLTDPQGSGDAVAWYLNHRGWAVKTSKHLLVIDYEQFRQVVPTEPSLANGFVTPTELSGQDVFVLFTSYHGDPGELAYVHTLEDSLANVTYIHDVDEPWRGCENTIYMGPEEKKEFGDFKVTAVRTTSDDYMPTLAYLCVVDGVTMFYAGFPTDDMETYKQRLEPLAEFLENVDIAFLPIPETGEEETSDFRYFLERFHPRAVCIFDIDRREYRLPELEKKVTKWGVKTQVFYAENPGDKCVYAGER
jgi:ankyrin repeat protein